LERAISYDPANGFPSGSGTTLDTAVVESTTIDVDSPGMASFVVTAFTQTLGAVAAETSEEYILAPDRSPSLPLTFAGKRVGRWDDGSGGLLSRHYSYDELSNLV
jgi:hypothetical protein